jgi:hypothetical protein
MAKTKKKAARQKKYFKVCIQKTVMEYRYVKASSEKEVKRAYDDGSLEDIEFDYDEYFGGEFLYSIKEI